MVGREDGAVSSSSAACVKTPGMKRIFQTVALAALAAGGAEAAELRLGLNSSVTLGCEVAGVRAGLQEGRFGGYVQGSYCTSNVQGQSGSAVFGGGLTFDLFQTPSAAGYALVGASTGAGGNGTIYGGLGARYGVPLLPFEAYVEGGVSRTSTLIGTLTSPRLALGVNYVWRGVDLSQAASTSSVAPSSSGSVSAPGVGGINVDQSGGGSAPAGGAAPATCNVSAESDAAAAQAVARAAANSALSAAATAYSAIYSNVSYDISVGSANISGNTATVTGTLTLRATNRTNGEPVSGTFSGVVTLARSGCSWVATGYRQNGEGE